VDILRSSPGASVYHSSASGSAAATATSQTATAATGATSQQAQTALMAQLAQSSLARATAMLHAQQSAQAAAQAAAAAASSSIPNGLAIGGLVPGQVGVDPANPATTATSLPVTVNANGSSITLAPDTAVTLPTIAAGDSQVTVSGTGTVGTVTTGGTITALLGGVATQVAPGSTISLPGGGTVTFAGGSSAPQTFSTYTLPTSWTGIGGMAQSTYAVDGGQTTVSITQTAQQALLTWQTFNIGKNTLLDFDQSAGGADVGQWVAINKIAADIAPSQILGAIEAPGQVYVINQNGIIFGGSSQVNVHTLVASSLPINPELIQNGLLNNTTDDAYLFSSLQDSSGNPLFTPQQTAQSVGGGVTSVSTGGVIVQAGAQLTAPSSSADEGGRIALVGPTVDNEGTITTPNGQTILAAGLQVGFQAHSSNDPTLRGLDVYVGAAQDPAFDAANPGEFSGQAVNGGLIEAPLADVLMTGADIEQDGVIDDSTSVALNGRIDLIADYGATAFANPGGTPSIFLTPSESGSVTLGPNSLTDILPELSSTDTVVGSQLALSSLIDIQASDIHLAANALLWAPSANTPSNTSQPALDIFGNELSTGITLNAGSWNLIGQDYSFINDSGTIELDAGSTIDASGLQDVSASVEENIVSVQLRGTELADSPVQQNGPLRGQTVLVDISQYGQNADGTYWIGSPIGDLSGYAALVQHTVGELTSSGGSVALKAGGNIDLSSDSTINVDGGTINYQGAYVSTTKLVSGGQIFDISQANPNLEYQGILSSFDEASAKYGISQSYADAELAPVYEPGYTQGGSAGSLSLTSPQMALQGNLYGNAVAGNRQIYAASTLPTTFGTTSGLDLEQSIYGIPTSGSLDLAFTQQLPTNFASPTPPAIVFQPSTGTAANPLSGDNLSQVIDLPASLVNSDGFGNLTINAADGDIVVPAGAGLYAPSGSSISFVAANIDVQDSIVSNGGSLSFTADASSPYGGNNGPVNRGTFTLGSGAVLDVSGVLSDENGASALPGSLLLSGGTVQISGLDVTLAPGSTINVSGGASLESTKLTFGSAGTLTILSGEDGALGEPDINLAQAALELSATLEGYSGLTTTGHGGTLNIQAPLIQIGGSSLLMADNSTQPVVQEAPGLSSDGTTLWLDQTGTTADFFSQGGFSNIALTGLGEVNRTLTLPSILVAAGTVLSPEVQTWRSTAGSNGVNLYSALPALASQRAPLNLSLLAPGVVNANGGEVTVGNIVIDSTPGEATILTTDPLGQVTLAAQTVVERGVVSAPGGTINIRGAANSDSVFGTQTVPTPLPTVDLSGTLSVAGTTELTYNTFGDRTGNLLSGGSISVSGNIVGESTAVLDVSGASDVLDVTPATAGLADSSTLPNIPLAEYSNGGSITLKGGQELYWDGTLRGAAGGAAGSTPASGGSLTVSSGFYPGAGSAAQNPADATLVITQDGPTIQSLGSSVIGQLVQGSAPQTDQNGNAIYGYFPAASFNQSGLGSLTLVGTQEFLGPVDIVASSAISVASGGFLFADDPVTLTAPYVAIGTALPTPADEQADEDVVPTPDVFKDVNGNLYYAPPTYGVNGVLNVNAADLLDVGDLSLQGVGTFNVNQGAAAAGDVRGAGTLDVAGNINIDAAQIYPATETTFTIASFLDPAAGAVLSGNIAISRPTGALPGLPYSAGGTLNLFGSTISQAGVLRAPIGVINLGAAPDTQDPLSNTIFGQAKSIDLASGSVTSVSAVDPTTGIALTIPYGENINGTEWQDPAGNNITAAGNGPQGVPAKQINIVAPTISDDAGATVDITGGGDLYAYRFVTGTGGTNDILALNANGTETSFAILPGYSASYAPLDPTSGYGAGSNLSVGQQIYLNGGSGLAAGYYTLLPARYALLPGAFLVTPASGTTLPASSVAKSDGSTLVGGYLVNGLASTEQPGPTTGYTTFEVAPESVVRSRAEYDDSYANTFLSQSAVAQNQPIPRLPVDAGQVVFNAGQSLSFNGILLSQPGANGQAGLVDISSASDILIDDTGLTPAGFTGLVLGVGQLNLLNAGSLLIGGTRGEDGSSVTVETDSIEVDNDSSAPLIGNDIALVSGETLTLDPGAVIKASAPNASSGAAPSLVVGGAGNDGFRLNDAGSSIPSLPGGASISFPQGTPAADQLSFAGAFTVTGPDGTVTSYPAGSLPVLAPGSTVTLGVAGELSLVSGHDAVHIVIPGALSPTYAQAVAQAIAGANDVTVTNSGDGALLRVSSSPNASITRTNVNLADTAPLLTIGAGVVIEGVGSGAARPVGALTVDSTAGVSLSAGSGGLAAPILSGTNVTFNGGLINIAFADYAGAGNVLPTTGLVLTGGEVQLLQQTAEDLNLLSYSSIDLYGDGTLGADSSGQVVVQNLALHAAEIRGFAAAPNATNQGLLSALPQRGVTLEALDQLTIDNSPGASRLADSSDPAPGTAGELNFSAPVIQLGGGTGVNSVLLTGFGQVNLSAPTEVLIAETASVTNSDESVTKGQATLDVTGANLSINTPLITGATGASQQIEVMNGDATILASGPYDPTLAQNLGAQLTVQASSITDAGNIVLKSGQATLHATGTAVGDSSLTVAGLIDLSGTSPSLPDATAAQFSSGGQVTLISDAGDVDVSTSATLNVSGASGLGTSDSQAASAGSLIVEAPGGTFLAQGSLLGEGGMVTSSVVGPALAQGQNGNFTLDVGSYNAVGGTSDLTSLEQLLFAGGFTQTQNVRIRTGNVEAIDAGDTLTAHTFDLSADQGNITVAGTIDASGFTGNGISGGAITLSAFGQVNLPVGSLLTVEGETFNDAGQGGSVALNAGAYTGTTPASSSTVNLAGDIDLKVDYLPVELNDPTGSSQNQAGDSVTLASAGTTIAGGGTFYLPEGTPGDDTLQIGGSTGGTITTDGVASAFSGSILSHVPAGSIITLNNPTATLTFASGTAGSIPVYLASDALFSANGATTLTGSAALPAIVAGELSGTLLLSGPVLDANGQVIPVNGGGAPASIAVGAVTGRIEDASSIVVEGYQVYQPAGGVIDTVEANVSTNGAALVANSASIIGNLYATNPNAAALGALTVVEPGAEIINPTGDLTLQNTWDFSVPSSAGGTFHFAGANGTSVPGILDLRAEGNLVFDADASLSDGFDNSQGGYLWEAPLFANGVRSWSYNLVGGADLSAADLMQVVSGAGSVEIGLGSANVDATALASSESRSSIPLFTQFYQTIRTGTGNISIAAGQDVQLLDALANIYTAGMQVPTPTQVLSSSYADFALPVLSYPFVSALGGGGSGGDPVYAAQYSLEGGNVSISALGNIAHESSTTQDDSNLVADSSKELPTSWLDRRGFELNGVFAQSHSGQAGTGETSASTSWWVDFSNFVEGVGALGGGNVTLNAQGNVSNVDAVAPTNARMPGLSSTGQPLAPNATTLVELGGGDVSVTAGGNLDGGVYYVERGEGTLSAGGSIVTNSTRATLNVSQLQSIQGASDPTTWLPTTLFLGQGSFDVSAAGSVLLGPVANPFLLPENIDNSFFERSYFSTYATDDSVNVSSLDGTVTIKDSTLSGQGSLAGWYDNVLAFYNVSSSGQSWSYNEPWLRLDEALTATDDPFTSVYTLMPPTLRAIAYSGDIDTINGITLSPSPTGTIDLIAAGSVNSLQPDVIATASLPLSSSNSILWSPTTINLSDANPDSIPGVASPFSLPASTTNHTYSLPEPYSATVSTWYSTNVELLDNIAALFAETGSTDSLLQTQEELHADVDGETLHANDSDPLQIIAGAGSLSGLTLYAGKVADIAAGLDITDIAFYLQNNQPGDVTTITAGRDILPYDATSPLRVELAQAQPLAGLDPLPGDIQIGGPGTIEVLAGRNLDLGVATTSLQIAYSLEGLGSGLVSIGNERNPFLPTSLGGANIVAAAGLGPDFNTTPSYAAFIAAFLNPASAGAEAAQYLPGLAALLGLDNADDDDVWAAFNRLPTGQQDVLALTIFYDVLRDAGRAHSSQGSDYTSAYAAIAALFPGSDYQGDITLTSREIKTDLGGNIDLLAPGGQLTVGLPVAGVAALDQGILTVDGGNISIFTNGNVNVGTSRIFTLHGGNEIIYSANGNIAAGASSKTVQSAPPTTVVVDPQSGDVETDLGGLATGGGIGVLETIVGAPPADVDLIAPKGSVDAGDAGIRASGNLNIAAVQVLNAGNIAVGGKSAGVPTTAAPNLAGIAAGSSAAGSATGAADEVARSNQPTQSQTMGDAPSIISVEVLGYGGGDNG
jgi:filamentous hemagglutinin